MFARLLSQRQAAVAGQAVGRPISQSLPIPPPIGGWNARDAISAMAPTDAYILDNFIPDTLGVKLRDGFSSFATGLGSSIESLMEYNAPGVTAKLFAAVGTAIYNVSAAGAVGAAVVSTLNNGRWQHTMFATSGSNYLVMANGEDDVRNYDGTVWTAPTITGVTSASLISVAAHMRRLWFIENGTLKIWYLGLEAISGAATSIDFGPLCDLGGQLLAMGSWTRDGGAGMEDAAVFVTDKGQVLIYSGIDPSLAATWSLIGIFKIPEPIGRRCLIKYGAELGVLTSQGFIPLSSILSTSETEALKAAATDKISGAFSSAYQQSSTFFGWQAVEYPKGRLLVINVPISEGALQHQFVMNAKTGGWCRFKGLNGGCWSRKGDDLYFGGNDGTVYKFGSVTNDNGAQIFGEIWQAFNSFGTPTVKRFTSAKPLFYGPEGYRPTMAVRLDYDVTGVTEIPNTFLDEGTYWDEEFWDEPFWAYGTIGNQRWISLRGVGVSASLVILVSLGSEFTYHGATMVAEVGGQL